MISPKYSIIATITGNVVDITYVDELEIHTALTYHCATNSVWHGPLLMLEIPQPCEFNRLRETCVVLTLL